MNILFTICGRAGSKGVKNKNLLDFIDVPLSFFTLAVMTEFRKNHASEYTCDIVLSTDSRELSLLVTKAAGEVFSIDRVPELSGDTVRKIDVIRDAARQAESYFGRKYDMVVDLDLTSPLRTFADLENVVEKRKISPADVVYTVTESRRNPWFNMVMKHQDGFYSTVNQGSFATRQQTPQVYDMNASIYGYSPEFISSSEPLFKKSDIVIMKDTGFLDIDSQEDFEMMQVIAAYLFEHDPSFGAVYAAAKAILESVKK